MPRKVQVDHPQKPLNPDAVAWAAGIIEGEGCVQAAIRKQAASQGNYLVHRIRVVMSDEDILVRLRDLFGIGAVHTYRNIKGLGTKQLYRWEAAKRADVVVVADAIYPWMGHRRKAAIDKLRLLLTNNPAVSGSERSRRTWVTRKAKSKSKGAGQ